MDLDGKVLSIKVIGHGKDMLLPVDEYISYGTDSSCSSYFAVVGVDLYHRDRTGSDYYRLLKRNTFPHPKTKQP